MREDIYFCLDLTENEHAFVQEKLQEVCTNNEMELIYYRKLKTGHIPCIREIKVKFNGKSGNFFRFMNDEKLWNHAKKWKDGKLVEWINPTESCYF